MTRWVIAAALTVLGWCVVVHPPQAQAHSLDPGYLELKPLSGTDWRVTWRKPQVRGQPMAISASLPENCSPRSGPGPQFDGRAFVSRWITNCEGGLAGRVITIEGLQNTRTDVLLRYQTILGGAAQTHRLTAEENAVVLPERQKKPGIAWNYFFLGWEHILEGVDHLLFVLTLLLLVRHPWKVAGAVTAFTLAHSITLGAAASGLLVVPAPFVETVIALSIAILAVELVRQAGNRQSLTARFPWIVSFAFGLLHGLGFARALLDIGLPQSDIVLALFTFNLGVEAGQVAFVIAVLAFSRAMQPILRSMASVSSNLPAWSVILGYMIGSVAAFWTIERLMGTIV